MPFSNVPVRWSTKLPGFPATCPTTRSRPTNAAEPSLRYIIKYSTCPSPAISPVNILVTAARVSFGRSWPSLYGFSSQLLMVNRDFATLFMFQPPLNDRNHDVRARAVACKCRCDRMAQASAPVQRRYAQLDVRHNPVLG